MGERKYYVVCGANCKFESMTKEQILAAIMQAVESGEIHDVDAGFITKLVEQNSKREVTLWVGTRAQYNAIAKPAENCLYIITDDTTAEDFDKAIAELRKQMAEHEQQSAITDFSDVVRFPNAAAHGVSINQTKFVYDAASGVVNFHFSIKFNENNSGVSFGTEILLDKYSPLNGRIFPFAICESSQAESVYKSGYISKPVLDPYCKIVVSNTTEIRAGDVLYVSGWYFV